MSEKLTAQQKAFLRAFGDGISYSEGTKGYDTYFGGGTFDNNKPHPMVPIRSRPGGQASTAAGRYQFMDFTWKDIHGGKNPPMTAENQEKAFVILLKRRKAYDDVLNGRFEDAYRKVTNEWASVKGNDYMFNGKPQGKHSPQALAEYSRKKAGEYSSKKLSGCLQEAFYHHLSRYNNHHLAAFFQETTN